MEIIADNSIDLNVEALKFVLEGKTASPRGMSTREVLCPQFILTNPTRAMPVKLPKRRLNPAIGSAEALQLISGTSYPRLLHEIAPAFARFMDGEVLSGAYGPRIQPQIKAVMERLRKDPDTRQAVMTIWDPLYDVHRASHDVPCTISLQFLLRDGKLHLMTMMRSNDAYLGFPYDIFQFSQLLVNVASSLGFELGYLVHRVTSFHVYERDVPRVEEIITATESQEVHKMTPIVGPLLGKSPVSWDDVQVTATQLLNRTFVSQASTSIGAKWHHVTLKKYETS